MVSSVPADSLRAVALPSPSPYPEAQAECTISADASDAFERSAFATMLEELGITSSLRRENSGNRIDFNFSFAASLAESLTASGFVAQSERTAAMSLTYRFEHAVIEHGKREVKQFESRLTFEARTEDSLSLKPFKKKEDITLFLNRLMKHIFTLMQDDSAVLAGISLDQDDLAELLGLDHGRVKRIFDGLVSAIMTMAMLKRMKCGAGAAQNVVLKGTRRAAEGIAAEKRSVCSFSCSIDIRCLTPPQPREDVTAHMIT
ncbi:MAG: hypothetical protein ACM3Q4_08850 [Acidobacteriota bacterium]